MVLQCVAGFAVLPLSIVNKIVCLRNLAHFFTVFFRGSGLLLSGGGNSSIQPKGLHDIIIAVEPLDSWRALFSGSPKTS